MSASQPRGSLKGAFKDVVVAVVNTKADEAALSVGDQLAVMTGAHATAILVSPLPASYYAGDGYSDMGVWNQVLTILRQDAQAEEAQLRARLAKAQSPFEFRTTELEYFLSREALLMSARHADLTVFTRPSEGMDRKHRGDLLETALFQSGRPVLLIPPDFVKPLSLERVFIAWKPSREAARAVGDAAALIDAAQSITLATMDAEPSISGPGEAPGADMAAHLARNGARIDVLNLDSAGKSEGDCLLAAARERNADIIVLGAYGHSRMRETVFGGVTKRLLEAADRPLFLSH